MYFGDELGAIKLLALHGLSSRVEIFSVLGITHNDRQNNITTILAYVRKRWRVDKFGYFVQMLKDVLLNTGNQ